jgi:hypothetical protein
VVLARCWRTPTVTYKYRPPPRRPGTVQVDWYAYWKLLGPFGGLMGDATHLGSTKASAVLRTPTPLDLGGTFDPNGTLGTPNMRWLGWEAPPGFGTTPPFPSDWIRWGDGCHAGVAGRVIATHAGVAVPGPRAA